MPGTRGMSRLIVLTTVGDGGSRRDQPVPLTFDNVLREVQGEGTQEPSALECTHEELSGLPRTIVDQDEHRSDGCLNRMTPHLVLERPPTPLAIRAVIRQAAMKAGSTIPAPSRSGAGEVSS